MARGRRRLPVLIGDTARLVWFVVGAAALAYCALLFMRLMIAAFGGVQ